MKKFRKLFSSISLSVVAVALGVCLLAGCGSNVKVAEIEEIMADSTTQTSFSTGFKFDTNISGTRSVGQVLFVDDGCEVSVVTVDPNGYVLTEGAYLENYLHNGYFYTRSDKTDKYTKTQVDDESIADTVATIKQTYSEMADMSTQFALFIESFKAMEGQGLKVVKTKSSGTLQYKLSYKDKTGEMEFVIAFKEIEGGYQITKFSASVEALGETVSYSFELFEGPIEFPEDLDTNVEQPVEPTLPEEGGEDETVQETMLAA